MGVTARGSDGPSVEQAFAAITRGDIAGAIAIYRFLLQRSPRDAALHVWLGQLLLLTGDFDAGWEECEWRPQRPLPMARWRGGSLNGARIFIHGEQGFGDNFQFVRYAGLVAERGGRVVVGTRTGLRPLLATVPGVFDVVESGETAGAVQWQIPMLSLPYVFKTRLDTVPNQVPYIAPDPVRAARWRTRLADAPGLKVGLVWSGNTEAPYNAGRSPGLAAMLPLLDCPGATFFGLQMGGGRADLETVGFPPGFVDLGPELADFSETAAAMMALDLVITPCTSTAHLAGALARPFWVILGNPDWRWMLEGETSAWYPTARLFRRPYGADWDIPVARMRAELERMVRDRRT